MRPLDGVRVLAFEQVLAGPYCTQMLAAFGAEVIKVEPPGGEHARGNPPFLDGVPPESYGGYFLSLNRNKKSVVLDLKTEEGKDAFRKLVTVSDVLVANYRPHTLEKMGLGFPELSSLNPRLIYATISGFGYPEFGESPYCDRPAFDIVAQAMGGLMSVTGKEDGEPTRVGISIGDIAAALFCAFGIMLALYWREKAGLGQWIDVSMVDSIIAFMENPVMRFSVTGANPVPVGNRHPSICPFDSFKAKDGYVVIAAGNDRTWRALCAAMGRPDLLQDPRFKDNVSRLKNHAALKSIIEAWTGSLEKDEVVRILVAAGCPAGPVSTVSEVACGEHARARQMIAPIKVGSRDVLLAGIPVKLSGASPILDAPPPVPGEHNDVILQGLTGFAAKDAGKSSSEGVV